MYKPKNEVVYVARKLIVDELAKHGITASMSGPRALKATIEDNRTGKEIRFNGSVLLYPGYKTTVRIALDEDTDEWTISNMYEHHKQLHVVQVYGGDAWVDTKVSMGEPDFENKIVQNIKRYHNACADAVYHAYIRCWWAEEAIVAHQEESCESLRVSGGFPALRQKEMTIDVGWIHDLTSDKRRFLMMIRDGRAHNIILTARMEETGFNIIRREMSDQIYSKFMNGVQISRTDRLTPNQYDARHDQVSITGRADVVIRETIDEFISIQGENAQLKFVKRLRSIFNSARMKLKEEVEKVGFQVK